MVAQRDRPSLRFSFTIATLGGNAPQSLGPTGVTVMNAIRSAGLQNYLINLMVMDYGSTTPSNCIVVNGRCDMGQSAIQAAENLRSFHGVPYNQIELTPMIGGNDTIDETFTLQDVATLVDLRAPGRDSPACTTGRSIAIGTVHRASPRPSATPTAWPARSGSPRNSCRGLDCDN